jgi:hypothetical protein
MAIKKSLKTLQTVENKKWFVSNVSVSQFFNPKNVDKVLKSLLN